MAEPKLGKSKNGKPMHYSVGALIGKEDKYLLVDRVKFPLGFQCPAGHIDEGEEPKTALKREIWEETGLKLDEHSLLFEEELDWDECSKGVSTHYYYFYKCKTSGELVHNARETKSIDWYTLEKMKNLNFEPATKYWLTKIGIL